MGLTGSFVDFSRASPLRTVTCEVPATTDGDRLVAVLDELIYLLDTEGVVPLSAEVTIDSDTVRLTMPVASLSDVRLVGAVPKAVALSGLALTQSGTEWRCRATIDV